MARQAQRRADAQHEAVGFGNLDLGFLAQGTENLDLLEFTLGVAQDDGFLRRILTGLLHRLLAR